MSKIYAKTMFPMLHKPLASMFKLLVHRVRLDFLWTKVE